MNTLAYLFEGYYFEELIYFCNRNPITTIIVLFFVTRAIMRWFFGISSLRRAQRRYTELLGEHTEILERQNQLMERHEGVMNKLGEKYL